MRVDAVQAQRVLLDGDLKPATIVVEHGRIAAIEAVDHPVDGVVLRAPDTAYVVPGVVDTHVHINEPGRTEWEGFVSATEAAALGGATTLIDMPLNSIPPTTTVEHLRRKQEAARDELMVDVGFWGGAVPGNLSDLEPLWDAGVFGFKCFLAPSGVDEFPPLDADQLHDALREIARFDGLMVVHAEDAAVLDEAPSPPSRAYQDFLLSRPDAAETTAIGRVLDGARETGARVHVLHLSSARALGAIADAKAEGLRVTVETCPHYLCFAAETIPDGSSQFKCCPPIRDAGNREELWQGLRSGVIDMVVSDHSPATAEEKGRGDGDLQQAWGGVSGLQVGFSAVVQEARRRNIGVEQVSRWMSRSTADLVGLTTKGRIEVGADADLAVYDTGVEFRIEATRLAHRNPISAYDGLRYGGRVTRSVVRGNAIDIEHPDHRWGQQLRRPGS
ncbi:allantoinase [Nocardioides sp. Root1257]|uniref:allantoinase AllB n=1 Tax=unclassified Nocardioides TaxID=2615069 RepID=UPI0006FA0E35|nr:MULTISPECIES: allantoinase AllB [unclassified Nocardioides]KQW46065.1 allantoinase [Nocardioides sp. Root1257]KRC43327.1 allantoinase [Nocardioides sp. Root224]